MKFEIKLIYKKEKNYRYFDIVWTISSLSNARIRRDLNVYLTLWLRVLSNKETERFIIL